MRTTSASVGGIVAASLCAGLLACARPPVSDSLDKVVCPTDGGLCAVPAPTSTISGAVVYSGPRRGDAVLLLFAANNLPPPDGTATSAVALARVPASQLFNNGASGLGPFSAPYLFSEVPAGTYQIRAFLDVSGDFDPFVDVRESPRAGAPTGGSVKLDGAGNASLTTFAVAANSATRVQVALGAEVPFDPPAFQLASGSPTSFLQTIDRPQRLLLQSINPGVPHAMFTNAKFALALARDSSGQPQISDGDGLFDTRPQVSLLQLQAVQADGSLLAVSGADAAIIPCKVVPTAELPLLLATPAGSALGANQLEVLVEPFAVKFQPPAPGLPSVAVPQPTIPAGRYALVVAEATGQVWTLPNSLGAQDPASGEYVASQAQAITVQVAVPTGGSISGKVHYPVGRTPHNLILQAFKGGPAFAPPLAAQEPTRVLSVPGRFISLGADRSFAYSLQGLSPGQYVVEALDDGDGNYNAIDFLETPTRGDLVGGVLDAHGNLASIAVQGAPITAEDVTFIGAPGQDGQGNGAPLDPPACVFDESQGPPQLAQDARGTTRLLVNAQALDFPVGDGASAATLFTVSLVRDAAGHPVDSDGDGLPDLWPRAFLALIDPTDPAGLALQSPAVAIPVAVDPTPFLPALLAPGADPSAVLTATQLSLIVRPVAVDLTNPAAPTPLPAMPAGRYKLILMNRTGQLWQVPNSAGASSLDPLAAALVNTASQSRSFAVVPPASPVPTGEIDGTLLLAGATAQTPLFGAWVFATPADNPPPPLGTGRPISADYHAASELAAGANGRSVSYALRGLPAGDYFVTALFDARGDFALDPSVFAAAPGPGSFAGGVLDATGALAPIRVAAAVVAAQTAVASVASPLPARPSFTLSSEGAPLESDYTTLFPDALTPQRITLSAALILGSQVAALAPESDAPQLPVRLQGCAPGSTTTPLDADGDNLPDLYPRVLVVKLADSDPTGLTPDPATTLIPAAVDPLPLLAGLGSCSAPQTQLVSQLGVILQPIAVQPQPDGSFAQVPIPPGRYGIVLESATGQLWRIPNELESERLDQRSVQTAAGQALLSQGVAIRVESQVPAARGGAIAGAIHLVGQSSASLGDLIVAAYDVHALPPPLGLGRPVAVSIIPRAEAQLAAGGAIPYLLANLPASGASAYAVLAMNDSLDQFSPSFDFMRSLPDGAQVAFVGGAVPTPIPVGTALVADQDLVLDAAAPKVPFDRPAFALGGALSLSQIATASPFTLTAAVPDGLPYAVAPTPMFHLAAALDARGLPYRDPNAPRVCDSNNQRPWATSAVYAVPIDTGSTKLLAVSVDGCQFCQALTGTAGCTAAPSNQPVAFAGPIAAVALPVAIDPATRAPVAGPPPLGHYAITLVEQTGQSWTVPNALAEVPGGSGLAQGAVFTVTP